MSTTRKLPSGATVTRWWNNGAYAWTIHGGREGATLDVLDIVHLAMFVDPVVFNALLERERADIPLASPDDDF